MHIGMINPSAVSISRTPCYNDLEIASLVHRALATIQDPGRFGDRKERAKPISRATARSEPPRSGLSSKSLMRCTA